MAKVGNPTTFSGHFALDPASLAKLGVMDPTLAVDTKLFIDPLLFTSSAHPEISATAVSQYRSHFEMVIKFLAASNTVGDVAWRSARRLLEFHELRGTCLGYGAASIHGSGFGKDLTERLIRVGKEVVDLGVRDPDLFPAMALFEADIGPDRISDMATNVIRSALVDLNARILAALNLAGELFDIQGVSGLFLRNPFQRHRTPIILVPTDVLRVLPIAGDWYGIADAAAKNDALRRRVNEHIGHIWAAKTKRDKDVLRSQVLASRDAFLTLLDTIHGVPQRAYNVDADPDGLVTWAEAGRSFASRYPVDLSLLRRPSTAATVYDLVKAIVVQFQHLVEHCGLNKELYKDGKNPRHESSAQRLFFAVGYCYCKANDVEISPEVDTGTGQIDFKISAGFTSRVLVEIKLSTNNKVVQGYETQLETYKASQQTTRAFYVVIDVGGMGKKLERLTEVRNAAQANGRPLSDLVVVDGTLKASASKRK